MTGVSQPDEPVPAPPILGITVRSLSLLLLVPAVRIAYDYRSVPVWSLFALVAATVAVAGLQLLLPRAARAEHGPGDGSAARRSRWTRRAIAGAVGAVAVGASLYQVLALSTPIGSDTASYWKTFSEIIAPTPGYLSLRTPLFQLLMATLRELGTASPSLLAVQVGARAVACAGVAWVLGRWSNGVALFVGVLVALDPVSAATSVVFLSESLYTTGLLLSLVLVVSQIARVRTVRPWELFGAGLVYGWAFLFRPAGLALIGPVLLAYAVGLRSLARAGLVLAGFSQVALAVAMLNVARAGIFAIAATGPYLAYPLFIHDLLDGQNGPASAAIEGRLEECLPGFDHRTITARSSNGDIQGRVWPCFLNETDMEHRALASYRPAFGALFRDAYVEAIAGQPTRFVGAMLGETGRFLSTTVAHYPAAIRGFARRIDLGKLCAREDPYAEFFSLEFTTFFCPTMREPDPVRNARVPEIGYRTRMLYQPYLYVYDPHVYVRSFRETPHAEMAGAAAVLFFLLTVAIVRPSDRLMVVGAAFLIVYSAAATAFGQYTLRRYVAVTSPFLLIVSGLFAVNVARQTWEVARAMATRARLRRAGAAE